jgi:hypothetical protein
MRKFPMSHHAVSGDGGSAVHPILSKSRAAGIRPSAAAAVRLLAASLWLSSVPVFAHVVPALREYDGSDPSPLPKLLSASGLYDNAASKTRAVTAGIKAYEVNSPLWSDGAAKQRFVDLPTGAKIAPTDSDRYVVPDKAVFIKNFMIDTVYGDSTTRILIETRFLVVRDNPDNPSGKKYLGLSYRWRRDQKDAELVDPGAGLDTVHLVRLNGRVVGKRWSYPRGSDCNQCHQGRGILGFITPQLNRPDAANPAVNQLKALYAAGILSADIYKTTLHRWTGLKETGAGATSEAKSRSYLAANCSHCHGNRVTLEGAAHDFDFFTPAKAFRFPDAAGGYVGKPTQREEGFPQIVYPGVPESSFVLFRMKSRGELGSPGPAQMPPLATYQMDSNAVSVMKDWICSLGAKPRACGEPQIQNDASYWEQTTSGIPPHAGSRTAVIHRTFRIGNGMLTVSPGAGPVNRISLWTTGGKAIRLIRMDERHWRIPEGLIRGVYLLRDGYGPSAIAVVP